MKKNCIIILLCISFFHGLFFPGEIYVHSQNFRFKLFTPEEGLSDNFVYNITQDRNGYLWLGTGEGITRFDGFDFVRQFHGDTLPTSPVRFSFTDSRGHVWFGYDNGSIAVLKGIKFSNINIDDQKRNTIKGIAEDQEGNILVATQARGLVRISPEFEVSYVTKGLEGQFISSFLITEGGDVLAGTFNGLYLYSYKPENDFLELSKRFDEIPFTNVHTITRKPGERKYFIGTQDEGLFIINEPREGANGYTIKPVGHEFGLEYSNIQSIYEDGENNLWLAVEGQGVVKLIAERDTFVRKMVFNEATGFKASYVRDIYEDIEGNIWFATYGSGLILLRNQFFGFYSFPDRLFNNILSIFQENDAYWLGTENGIIKISLDTGFDAKHILDTRSGLPSDRITSLTKDSDGNLWIGTGEKGIFLLPAGSSRVRLFFSSPNSLENAINSFAYNNYKLYAATNGGLIIFDLKDNSILKLTTFEGLPHNRIRHVFRASNGQIWIATRSNGIYNIDTKKELTIDARAELEFVSIIEDKEGYLWAATNGDGVFRFSDESPDHFSTGNGLRSNYCYSLSADENGMIWVGHSMGVSRINPENNVVQVFSVEHGVGAGFNFNSVVKNKYGQLVFGTTEGILLYDHTREKAEYAPPVLNITSLRINDQDYDFSAPVVLPYSRYRVRLDFIGINFRDPEKVSYQYKLQGYDDWSEVTAIPYAYYSRLEDGNYTFLLRACNEQGICTEEPLSLEIIIGIPVWKAWWFILMIICILIAGVYVFIKLRERKQRKVQEYLEKLLDKRTREVRAQKEEIENKNRDITDSINYAQRIQASILPPVKRLLDYFSGSFVFYQPKDIVSGDFYWYDKVWGNKFLIVCADSTGHGVPGAFMSMIGTTLIKDICARPEVRSPSALLLTLDKEVKEALNQNIEEERSNDGMDIIVAEIDLETKELRVASAMRPLILYKNGEPVYVKGSRSSVGGRLDDEMEAKEFADERFSLEKGDIIYMFSDGYPDQFGGPLGKKFKMVRLRNLLRDINGKPMDEQYQYIKSNFFLWKEELEQVDDVLFMGIRI